MLILSSAKWRQKEQLIDKTIGVREESFSSN